MVKSIYVIKNTINDKVYVGQAINPHRRFVQHLCNGNRSLDNLPIHLAIKKYGKQNFYYEILEENIENYDEKEAYWIKKLNSISPNGYNILEGGTKNPIMYGENHPRNTLTDKTVNDIIEDLLFSNETQRSLAKKYNTTERIINSITSGACHKKEELNYPLRLKGCHFSKNTLEEIYWLLENSEASLLSIANYYGLTKGAIAQINKGSSHYDATKKYPIRPYQGLPIDKQDISIMLAYRKEDEEMGKC